MAFYCCSDKMTPEEEIRIENAIGNVQQLEKSCNKIDCKWISNCQWNEIDQRNAESIKDATDANTAEIAAIKSLSTQTDANIKKVSEQNASMKTPVGPALNYVREYRARSHANVAATTPKSAKRQRPSSPVREKNYFPMAKVGMKTNAIGLAAVPKVDRIRDVQPKFAKALYVSRLNPATTNEQLSDYIVTNTPVTEKSKFNVHKMIKKGVDKSTLKFVSFKVEMNAEKLNILDDVNLWPEGVQVREFQQVPRNELGNYFPALNANEKTKTTNELTGMEM